MLIRSYFVMVRTVQPGMFRTVQLVMIMLVKGFDLDQFKAKAIFSLNTKRYTMPC